MSVHPGNGSFAIGVAFARDATLTAGLGADVSEVETDLVGVLARSYRANSRGPRGLYFATSLTIVVGDGVGEDDAGSERRYRYVGYDVSIIGVGYQVLIADRLALDISGSLRQALGFLKEKDGGDNGAGGGQGGVIAGSVGLAF